MKNKNYYEVLGVAPHVGSGQVQAAYRFARSLYTGESTPTYGLLDNTERSQMIELVEEAYNTLSNPNARREYDLSLTRQDSMARVKPVPEPERAEREVKPVFPKRDLVRTVPPPVLEPAVTPLPVPDLVNGGVLRSLREKRGLTIDQIAALSKVGGRFLKALEEDRHDALPGKVFARGFLIEYARAIRASETEIVERYLRYWTGK